MDLMNALVPAHSFRVVRTLISWPGCWLGIGMVPTIRVHLFIIIIDARLSWRLCFSCGSMLEDAAPITQSAYSILSFARLMCGIGTKRSGASHGKYPLGNSFPA